MWVRLRHQSLSGAEPAWRTSLVRHLESDLPQTYQTQPSPPLRDLVLEMPGSASLSAIAGRLGMARSGQAHCALEDAWLAMMAYLAQHECPARAGFDKVPQRTPANLKAAPPMPAGPLPRYSARR